MVIIIIIMMMIIIIIVRGAFERTMIQLYISFRVAHEFQGAYHVLFSLSLSLVFFYVFSKWINLLLVQVKHKRTLYKFLLSKLEICNGNVTSLPWPHR